MENLEIFRKNGFDFLIDEDGGLSTVVYFQDRIWYIFLQIDVVWWCVYQLRLWRGWSWCLYLQVRIGPLAQVTLKNSSSCLATVQESCVDLLELGKCLHPGLVANRWGQLSFLPVRNILQPCSNPPVWTHIKTCKGRSESVIEPFHICVLFVKF